MNIRLLVVRAFDLPFQVLIKKTWRRLESESSSLISRIRASIVSTRTSPAVYLGFNVTALLNRPPDTGIIKNEFPRLRDFNDQSLAHRFNLLGSGWVAVEYGCKAKGVEGYRYNSESTPLDKADAVQFAAISNYKPIDWHLDFKSGYRWNPKMWWRNIPHAHLPGVDIKVPWELSRMQHLTAFALEAIAVKDSNPDRANQLKHETQNQILDFISQNTPLFGVNWRCAMDVGIRAANWVLALDLFRAAGFKFHDQFHATVLASLHDHGNFISNNFENYPDFRGNHYLANICGLAFIACALPMTSEKRERWIQISKDELRKEIEYQFNPDGSNFEGSTAYHRLSAEMVIFAFAVLREDARRKGEKFEVPGAVSERIQSFDFFSSAMTKPSGHVVQIGDNDSGRFFKFPPRFKHNDELEEDFLDQQDLTYLTRTLFGRRSPQLSSEILSALLSEPLTVQLHKEPARSQNSNADSFITDFTRAKFKQEYFFEASVDLLGIRKFEFPDFGAVIFKSGNCFLSFRCGPLGQKGRAGHDHVDQLSIELEVDGRLLLADPGTYLYTALPKRRNEYRSRYAHFTPRLSGGETADLDAGLFYLRNVNAGEIRHIGELSVCGRCRLGDSIVYRLVNFEATGVRVRDWSHTSELDDLRATPTPNYSDAYGRK